MSYKKASSPEDEFIAREEAKRRELQQIAKRQAAAAAGRQQRRGTCPGGCETKLIEEGFRAILIDRCPTCGGVWLDPGEFDKISPEDGFTVRSFLDFFRRTPRA